jgi:hypothetical protein
VSPLNDSAPFKCEDVVEERGVSQSTTSTSLGKHYWKDFGKKSFKKSQPGFVLDGELMDDLIEKFDELNKDLSSMDDCEQSILLSKEKVTGKNENQNKNPNSYSSAAKLSNKALGIKRQNSKRKKPFLKINLT